MIDIGEILLNLWQSSGFNAIFANFTGGGWQNLVMLVIACVLLYLGIVKKFEPLLRLRLPAVQPAPGRPVPPGAVGCLHGSLQPRLPQLW